MTRICIQPTPSTVFIKSVLRIDSSLITGSSQFIIKPIAGWVISMLLQVLFIQELVHEAVTFSQLHCKLFRSENCFMCFCSSPCSAMNRKQSMALCVKQLLIDREDAWTEDFDPGNHEVLERQDTEQGTQCTALTSFRRKMECIGSNVVHIRGQ